MLQNAFASSDEFIKTAMETMTDSQLEQLLEALEKKSGVRQEERLKELAYVVIDDLSHLDACVPHVNRMKRDLLWSFIDLYVRAYGYEKSSSLAFNHEKFAAEVRAESNYRRGIRRMTRDDAPPPSAPEASDVGVGSCALM
eukprot:UN3541